MSIAIYRSRRVCSQTGRSGPPARDI